MKPEPRLWLSNNLHAYLNDPDTPKVGIEVRGQTLWVPARAVGVASFMDKVRLAWLVFTGQADALMWTVASSSKAPDDMIRMSPVPEPEFEPELFDGVIADGDRFVDWAGRTGKVLRVSAPDGALVVTYDHDPTQIEELHAGGKYRPYRYSPFDIRRVITKDTDLKGVAAREWAGHKENTK